MNEMLETVLRGRTALHEGRHADALRDMLAAYNIAQDEDPAARRSYGMAGWRELMAAYPPARAAFEALRAPHAARIMAGAGSREDFREVCAMNRELGDAANTTEIFTWLDANQPDVARACFSPALSDLVASGAFALARRYLPTPLDRVRQCADQMESIARLQGVPPQRLFAEVTNCVREVQLVAAVLRGCGETAEADKVRATTLEAVKNPTALAAADKEFDQPGAARDAWASLQKG